MELKKNPNADLTRKTGLFFSIGLLVTMSIVLMAFEWKQSESKIDDIASRNFDSFDDMDVVATEILPPAPPEIKAPIIIEVPDEEPIEEIKINLHIDVTEETAVAPIVVAPVEPEVNPDEVFIFVESPATFEGGLNAFYKHIGNQFKYPPQARRMGIKGKVHVEFVVDKDGSLIDVKAINSIGGGCDEEAVRVIKNSPKWNPGKQRGKAVKQRMVLPVIFELN